MLPHSDQNTLVSGIAIGINTHNWFDPKPSIYMETS